MTADRRVFLHIGLHKTATTYLQGVLGGNVRELAAQGVYYPMGEGVRVFRAVDDLQGRRPRDTVDRQINRAWPALVRAVDASSATSVVISDERLSLSGGRAINRVAHDLAAGELHVVVTVRDLARVLVSSWEEAVRGSATWTWSEYIAAIRDPARRGTNPARGFWVRQDLGRICAAWEAAVPAERIHLVTVPPRGAQRRALLERFGACVGIDTGPLEHEPAFANESTGVAGTEVIRRLNARLGTELNQREYGRAVGTLLAPALAKGAQRAALPRAELEWVRERAEADCALVRERGYDVVGDLDDLLPADVTGRAPDDATDEEVLAAALDALAAAAETYARTWWRRRSGAQDGAPGASVAGSARGALFRVRRALLAAGDRGGPLGRLVSFAYRAREARGEKAMRSARRRRSRVAR